MMRRNGKTISLADKVQAAFDQASRKVIQRARQTGTPVVVVWKDGHIEQISSEQVDMPTVRDQSDADNP